MSRHIPVPYILPRAGEKNGFYLLVVDDNESNRETLRRRLDRHGYTVYIAASGQEALKKIAEENCDLILLDVMMPGMSGLEVLEELRKSRSSSDLPVIMATAKDESADIVEALEKGANDYVIKPLDFSVVLARIHTQLLMKTTLEQVMALERQLSQRNGELEAANKKLTESAEQTRRELATAARVQKAFLPHASRGLRGAKFAWALLPCQALAGDSLNFFALDADHIGFYLLDVSGHGTAAALLAVAASRFLSVSSGGDSLLLTQSEDGMTTVPTSPAEVAARLSRILLKDADTEQFITLFYGIFDWRSLELRYVSAGHPESVLIRQGEAPQRLKGVSMPVGVGDSFGEQTIQLRPGDRVYVYSDGITEAMDMNHDLFGLPRLEAQLDRPGKEDLNEVIQGVLQSVQSWTGPTPARDDVSILAMQCE